MGLTTFSSYNISGNKEEAKGVRSSDTVRHLQSTTILFRSLALPAGLGVDRVDAEVRQLISA